MSVGSTGSATGAPGARVVVSMGVRVRSPKLPTRASVPTTAMVCGPVPTAIGVPACRVETSIGVTVLLPKSTTSAVLAAPAEVTAMATGSVPTAMGGPARQVPRSTGVTELASRLATRATPAPCVPPGATATASGSTPTLTECSTVPVSGSISCRVSSPWLTTSRSLSPSVKAMAEGRLPTATLGSARCDARLTGVMEVPGKVTEAPVATQAMSPDGPGRLRPGRRTAQAASTAPASTSQAGHGAPP